MRTAKITIDGQERLLCFSTRVVRDCTDRYGGIEHIDEALSGDPVKALDETIWILSALINAGDRYARLNGIDNPPAVSYDDLYDIVDMADLQGLNGKIRETITGGMERNIEAEPPKNGKATPGKK